MPFARENVTLTNMEFDLSLFVEGLSRSSRLSPGEEVVLTVRVRHRRRTILVLLGLLPIIGACGAPVPELRAFREAIVAANTASTPMLDDLAASERRAAARIVSRFPNRGLPLAPPQPRRSDLAPPAPGCEGPGAEIVAGSAAATPIGVQRGDPNARPLFFPADARFHTDIGDPPGTEAMRRGHAVLLRAADLLLALAEGSGAAADVAALDNLRAEFSGLLFAADLAAASSITAVAGAFEVARPLLVLASRSLQRREARELIRQLQECRVIGAVIDALVQATPAAFQVLLQDASSSNDDAAIRTRAAALRRPLSNYVVLLRQVEQRWNDAARAAISGSRADLQTVTANLAELRVAAEQARRAYVAMRGP